MDEDVFFGCHSHNSPSPNRPRLFNQSQHCSPDLTLHRFGSAIVLFSWERFSSVLPRSSGKLLRPIKSPFLRRRCPEVCLVPRHWVLELESVAPGRPQTAFLMADLNLPPQLPNRNRARSSDYQYLVWRYVRPLSLRRRDCSIKSSGRRRHHDRH